MEHQNQRDEDEDGSSLWNEGSDDCATIHFTKSAISKRVFHEDQHEEVHNVGNAAKMPKTTIEEKMRLYDGDFVGACLDTGAQRSVCGLSQARAYDRSQPRSLKLSPQSMRFKFGQQISQSIGTVNIRIPQDEASHITLDIHVVDLDIPLIIGLDVLKAHSLLVNYVENVLEFRELNVRRPLTYKREHVFLEWDQKSILFTREELTRLHLHFMHPAADKLFQLIRRAKPESATTSVKQIISEISSACLSCQEYRSRPLRFKASVPPDNIVFNQSISIDLLWLDEVPVLHVIDDHTEFFFFGTPFS